MKKKVLALLLASVMVMGSSVTTYAEEPDKGAAVVEDADKDKASEDELSKGELVANGGLEGLVESDVFSVEVPTIKEEGFEFKLDPERLIERTDAVALGEATFTPGTVYFKNVDEDGKISYAQETSAIKITSRSAGDVDVKVSAQLKEEGEISLVEKDAIEEATTPSMYMAIVDVENDDTKTLTKNAAAELTATIEGKPEGYKLDYDKETKKYSCVVNDEYTEFNTFTFKLEADANSKGDWTSVKEVNPKLEIKWEIRKSENQKSMSELLEKMFADKKPADDKKDSVEEAKAFFVDKEFTNEKRYVAVNWSDDIKIKEVKVTPTAESADKKEYTWSLNSQYGFEDMEIEGQTVKVMRILLPNSYAYNVNKNMVVKYTKVVDGAEKEFEETVAIK